MASFYSQRFFGTLSDTWWVLTHVPEVCCIVTVSGLEVNAEKSKDVFVNRDQNAG